MRILHIITGLQTGGAEMMLYKLMGAMRDSHFDAAVLSLMPLGGLSERIFGLGIPVYSLRIRSAIPSPSIVLRLQRLMRSFRPEVIQGWMYHGNLAAALARSVVRERPALVWNVRQNFHGLNNEKSITRQIIRANRILSRGPDAIIYNSQVSRRRHEAFGFFSDRGVVIPNGFDLERYRPLTDVKLRGRDAIGIPANSRVVGHVARLHPMKDHRNFLLAAVRVANQFDDVHFLLAGRDVTQENASLIDTVPAQLRSRFHWLGERSDIEDLMHAMDVFALSSWGESFSNVLGEAMACGIPCVATDVGDSAQILGGIGRIVPPKDPNSLTMAITDLLGLDPCKRVEMGTAARLRIMTKYSIPKIASTYVSLYESLVVKAW